MTVVLLPNRGGDYRGIVILEPCWKIMEIMINTRMNVITSHDYIHGLLGGRGTRMATIEAKLA